MCGGGGNSGGGNPPPYVPPPTPQAPVKPKARRGAKGGGSGNILTSGAGLQGQADASKKTVLGG